MLLGVPGVPDHGGSRIGGGPLAGGRARELVLNRHLYSSLRVCLRVLDRRCPWGLAADLDRQHGCALLGTLGEAAVSYFAVTVERVFEHPGVAAIWGEGAG